MSLNTAHANGGVLIHAGESIILFCDNVEIEFSGQDSKEFKGRLIIVKDWNPYITPIVFIFKVGN